MELDKYIDPTVPWHWHRTVELFYIESGALEYTTPNGKWVFSAGSGGFVNANILHSSRVLHPGDGTVQLLHLFDPVLLAGEHGSRMDAKYIHPLTAATSIEIIALDPNSPEQAEILREMRQAFTISDTEWGYEFRLRRQLTDIWLKLFQLARPAMRGKRSSTSGDEKVKSMMAYIHDHFRESISVDQLAEIVHVSKRVCFRLFQDHLHMTPVEYMRSYRLREACQMLAHVGASRRAPRKTPLI